MSDLRVLLPVLSPRSFRRHRMIQPRILTAAIALALGSSGVWAACGVITNLAGAANCTASSGDAILDIDGANASIGGDVIKADTSAPGRTARITISNAQNITNLGSGEGVWANGYANAIVFASGVNNITLRPGADTAVLGIALANGSGNSGDSTITVNAGVTLNVQNLGLPLLPIQDQRDGLEVNASGTGNARIEHHGAGLITTVGGNGLFATHGGAGGNAEIVMDGSASISTTGDTGSSGRHGLYAVNYGTGDATITATSTGTITTAGNGSAGVFANANNGNAQVTASGEVSTTGNGGAAGVRAQAGGAGNASVDFIGGHVETHGDNADAIFALALGTGTATVTAAGELVTHGAAAFGIAALTAGGDASATFTGSKIDVNGTDSSAIYASSLNGAGATGAGKVNVVNTGALTARGDSGRGIYTKTASGNTDIINSGGIETQGANADGIFAETVNGLIRINNTGDISAIGNNSSGIRATNSNGGGIEVVSNGRIQAADGHGIAALAASGDSTINASNDITTGQATASTNNHGLEASTMADGKASVYYDNGTIKVSGNTAGGGNDIGVVAWDHNSNAASVNGYISLGSNAIVDASQGVGGVQMRISGNAQLDVAQGAQVHGGANDGYGVSLSGVGASASHTVNNLGLIDAMSDRAITSDVAGGNVRLENYGTITGYISTTSGTNLSFNNWTSNGFNLRNFADTNGDGVRDTKAVSVSTFGGADSTFVNQAGGVVRLLAVSGEQHVDTSNQWLADGLAVHDISNPGINQAQLLNLGRFENHGTIDLTGNGLPGDTLIISGGTAPGLTGPAAPGVFVTDGGVLRLDTVLNKGDSESQTDILSVDSVKQGSAPTAIYINRTGGNGAITAGNGIEVVNVRNGSDPGAFVLANRLVVGPYEYMLYQGGRDHSSNSWFLSTRDRDGKAIYRAETGSYLGNQTAATGMFMHTLHDRIGEPQYTDAYKAEGKVPSVWLRVVGNRTNGSAGGGVLDQDTDTHLVHLGGELATWSNGGNDRWHFGLMGAYGESNTDTSVTYHLPQSVVTRTSTGKVDGYSVGAYATWYQNQNMPTGLYLDGWLQYGWFNNKVTGKNEPTQSYNSDLFTVSLEAGYAFIAHDGEKRQWMIEPQAQLAYNSYNADDVVDSYGMKVSGSDANGVVTRLGARLYSRSKLGDNGLQPFIETNWWYGSANNSLQFGGASVADDTPENRFELKAGLQGEIAKGWQMWGHIGGMWGEHSYDRYEGMVGLKKLF